MSWRYRGLIVAAHALSSFPKPYSCSPSPSTFPKPRKKKPHPSPRLMIHEIQQDMEEEEEVLSAEMKEVLLAETKEGGTAVTTLMTISVTGLQNGLDPEKAKPQLHEEGRKLEPIPCEDSKRDEITKGIIEGRTQAAERGSSGLKLEIGKLLASMGGKY